MSSFVKLIDRMEDLVLTGGDIPLTPWTIVNADKLVPLMDRIRDSLPEEIKQAQMIMSQRNAMLEDAHQKATGLMEEARSRAERMLSESELMKAVRAEADRVRQQMVTELEQMRKQAFEEVELNKARSMEEARKIKEGADQYAEVVLNSLEKSLGDFQTVVRNGQTHLRQSKLEASRSMQASLAQHKQGAHPAPQAKRPVRQAPPNLQQTRRGGLDQRSLERAAEQKRAQATAQQHATTV